MDAQFLTKPWAQVPWQVLAVIDRAGTQAAYPGHLFQQVGDIPVEVQVPQVSGLDDGLHGCKGMCPVGAPCKQGVHPDCTESAYNTFRATVVWVQVGTIQIGTEQHLTVEVVVHALHDELIIPVEVVTAPDPGGELLEQGQRFLPADSGELLPADALFVQPPTAMGLVGAVDPADDGEDPVNGDVPGRTLRIGAGLLGIDEFAPQVRSAEGKGEPVILLACLVTDVGVCLQIPAVVAHDALEDIAGARYVILEISGRLARGRTADDPHPGIEAVPGVAGVWFWGYGLDYAAVKVWCGEIFMGKYS